jgi:hypothetical protein
VLIQFAGQQQIGKQDRAMFFEVLFSHATIFRVY